MSAANSAGQASSSCPMAKHRKSPSPCPPHRYAAPALPRRFTHSLLHPYSQRASSKPLEVARSQRRRRQHHSISVIFLPLILAPPIPPTRLLQLGLRKRFLRCKPAAAW